MSSDSFGWNGLSADQIYTRVMGNMGWGKIVLMHVGAASQDANALDRIIRELERQGYAFGTFADVIAEAAPASGTSIRLLP